MSVPPLILLTFAVNSSISSSVASVPVLDVFTVDVLLTFDISNLLFILVLLLKAL